MKNNFVSFEIAKNLKELGFNEPSKFGMDTSLYTNGNLIFYSNYGFFGSGSNEKYVLAPLKQEAITWLRNNYGIHIQIRRLTLGDGYEYNDFIYLDGQMRHTDDTLGNEFDSYEDAEDNAIKTIIRVINDNKLMKII